MSNGWEIAGSCVTLIGTIWLSAEAFFVRRRIREEAGANEFLDILKKVDAGKVLKNNKGEPIDSKEALSLWLAGRTIAWSWGGLACIAFGFALDLIGKISS